MTQTVLVSPQVVSGGAPLKRAWRFPGVFGLIRFLLTGKWPVVREDDDSDHSRFAERLGRALALPMFVVFSIGALLSVVQEPIQRNWNAYSSGHAVNATEVLAVFITLCLFGYGDITMVSAAGTLRDKIANSRPAGERVFPSFLVFAIAILESVAFGGLIYLLEHPTTAAGWVSLIGRSVMGPLCVIWFAVTPKRIPTQDEMDARFIYRLAMAREEILKTINFKSVNNLMFLPVIEQLRLWLNKDWNKDSEARLNEFMEMLRKLAPTAGEASFNDIQALIALLESQRQLAEATANKVDVHLVEVDARLKEANNRFATWIRDAKDEMLREVQRLFPQGTPMPEGDGYISLPEPGTDAFVDLIGQVRRALTDRDEEPTVAAMLAELAEMGYDPAAETDVARALVTLGNRLRATAGVSNNVAVPSSAKAAPKPGTKRFNALVYDAAQRLLSEERMTIFNIAQELQVDPQAVQDAITTLQRERLNRLRPGKELAPDPVLDTL